jgi:hypothetical protein
LKNKRHREFGLLLGWVVSEGYSLLNISLQALHSGFEENLFLLIKVGERVQGLASSTGLFDVSNK